MCFYKIFDYFTIFLRFSGKSEWKIVISEKSKNRNRTFWNVPLNLK